MDTDHTLSLLQAGGLVLPPHDPIHDSVGSGAPSLPKYNALADPEGAEALCRELAARLRGHHINVILIWEDPEDVALGHIVGRELNVPTVRAFNADGLVARVGDLPPSPSVLLLTDAFRDALHLRALAALVAQQGGEVAAMAALVDTPVMAEAESTLGGASVSLVSYAYEPQEL